MPARFIVPAPLASDLRVFLAAEGIPVEVAEEGEGDVRVVQGSKEDASDFGVLVSGGHILCARALALAPKLGLKTKDLGKILTHLNVKIRSCSLGCF